MEGVTRILRRGDVWEAEFDPVRGREQAGRRPALIVSANRFNHGTSELVLVVPITSRNRGVRSHVPVEPPEGGATVSSFVVCEQVRVFAKERLLRRRGSLGTATMAEVDDRLRVLLDL